MPSFVEIAVNVPGKAGIFDYHLPPELEEHCQPGHLVEVPFGRQRVYGVVLRYKSEPQISETRPVIRVLDPEPVLTPAQIVLADQLAEATLASLADCIDLMLPPGLWLEADVSFSLNAEKLSPELRGGFTETQRRLVDLLQKRGPLQGRQIDYYLPHANWQGAARGLIKRGILSTQAFLPSPGVRPKHIRTVQLASTPEQIEAMLPSLGRAGSAARERREKILRFLILEPGLVDVAWVYAESGGNLSDLHHLVERGLVILGETEVWRDPLAGMNFVLTEAPELTDEQKAAWNAIKKGLQESRSGKTVPPYLLHGVTGSGKTEIYLRAAEEVIQMGRQVIVLVPEIALTPQTVRRFMARFPGQVGLMHSGLSRGERFDTWRRARAGQVAVMVGPRSALFTPFKNLGLIIVDEFHDDSYYQRDLQPHYHARQAAVLYAHLAGAVCLLGSATPDVTSFYQADQKRWQSLRLPRRILAHRKAVQSQVERLGLASRYQDLQAEVEYMDLPPIRVVDMRAELKSGNRSIFSRDLQAALAGVIEAGQQAILFLNRRGAATYIFCRECGYVLKCPKCDLPLTYHVKSTDPTGHGLEADRLTCHTCNYRRKMPASCPKCGSKGIRHYGTGTESVEAEVQALFPAVRTLRWDYETTRQKGAHEVILTHFINHHADVLIGTQMIAKGLDLPLVTLVGVVLADVGLNLPDFRAGERTFQILTQVAGRAGRSPLGGQVIVQTFQPEHYVIRAAAGHDFQAFYQQELEYRRQLRYPPFTRLVRLEFQHTDPHQAEATAHHLSRQLHDWILAEQRRATEMIGPAPCFYSRMRGEYRWQIILRGPDPASLLKGRDLAGWDVEVDPVSLL